MVLIDISLEEPSLRLFVMNFLYAFIVTSYAYRTGVDHILFMDKFSKTYLLVMLRCEFFKFALVHE